MQTKFNYTSGGEFTTSNTSINYIGYFNVDDNGNVYTEKYYDPSLSVLLIPSNQYGSDYYRFSYFKDRYIYDTLRLPHTLDEILIQSNELVNFNVLNKKIEYIQNNLIYVYSKIFIGSTEVPIDNKVNSLANLIGTDKFEWISKSGTRSYGFGTLASVSALSAHSEYDKMHKFVVIPFINNKGIGIFGISDTYLIGLSSKITVDGQMYDPAFTFYTDVIDNNTNEKCENLEDITFDGKYLYVSDSKINGGGQVFKYDVSGYYTNDEVFENKRFLIEPIGGFGNIDKKNKFNRCSVLGSKSNELWVYDSGNNAIKTFDNNFVYKKTIKIPNNNYNTYTILDIRHRVMNNHIYVLFKRVYDNPNDTIDASTTFGLFEYNENHLLQNTYIFEDYLFQDTDIEFQRMAISQQDSNVFYVITHTAVFKKFFTRPEKTFAVFSRTKLYDDDIFRWGDHYIERNWESLEDFETWNHAEFMNINLDTNDIYIIGSNQNKDDLYFMGSSYISHSNEKTEYFSLLNDEKMAYYNLDSIKLDKTEYNQSFVLNKELYKLVTNIIQFKNNLKGKFYAEYNNYGDLVYNQYIYFTDDEIKTLDINLDYNSFINDNELVQPNAINRIFTNIYKFQNNLLNLTKAKLKNIKTWVDIKNNTNIYPLE